MNSDCAQYFSYLSGKSSVLEELPPETDIEPHINVGTKYQAICPNLEGSTNDKGSHAEAIEASFGEKKVSSIQTSRVFSPWISGLQPNDVSLSKRLSLLGKIS